MFAVKRALKLNNNEATLMARHAGFRRVVFNFGLSLGFYEFQRQLDYKCKMYGATLVLVDQWLPSSKTCSNCGHKKDMPLRVRTFDCPACGLSLDRDLNASLNILNWEPKAIGG